MLQKAVRKIEQFKDRHFYYGKVLNSAGQVIDEVLAVLMKGPRSYTTEDVVEIHCHGGMIPVTSILKEVIKKGLDWLNRENLQKEPF